MNINEKKKYLEEFQNLITIDMLIIKRIINKLKEWLIYLAWRDINRITKGRVKVQYLAEVQTSVSWVQKFIRTLEQHANVTKGVGRRRYQWRENLTRITIFIIRNRFLTIIWWEKSSLWTEDTYNRVRKKIYLKEIFRGMDRNTIMLLI